MNRQTRELLEHRKSVFRSASEIHDTFVVTCKSAVGYIQIKLSVEAFDHDLLRAAFLTDIVVSQVQLPLPLALTRFSHTSFHFMRLPSGRGYVGSINIAGHYRPHKAVHGPIGIPLLRTVNRLKDCKLYILFMVIVHILRYPLC